MKQLIQISFLLIMIPCLLAGCKPKTTASTNSSGAQTSPVKETMADNTTEALTANTTTDSGSEKDSSSSVDGSVETDSANNQNSASKNTAPAIKTYTENKVSIQYPVIKHSADSSKEAAINDLLKTNALSVLTTGNINRETDFVEITCKIISADRNRVTAVYTGSYQTTEATDKNNIFFANTVDLAKVCSLGFNDYADAYTMAGYLLSDDCQFYQTSKEKSVKLNEFKKENDLHFYTKLFSEADFPSNPSFPESFSYENQGILYFSIPVSHELGDYALVRYQMDQNK